MPSRKSQAMRIVRTIGQAFEVCHKLGGQSRPVSEVKDDASDRSSEDNERRVNAAKNNEAARSPDKKELNRSTSKTTETERHKPTPPSELRLKHGISSKVTSPVSSPVLLNDNINDNDTSIQLPLSQHHQMQLVRQQLEQQQHQTQVAIAQVHLLKDQLSAETAARIEAQARAHQLLLHNKDLLDHVTVLVSRVQALEMKVNAVTPGNNSTDIFQVSSQASAMPDVSTPRPAPVYLPDMRPANQFLDCDLNGTPTAATFVNPKATGLDADSPDSGHKEMSSESLTHSLTNSEINGWINPYGSAPSSSSLANHDAVNGSRSENGGSGWLSSQRASSSPPSSSPSKSSTLKGGSSNSIDHQRCNSNSSQSPSPFNNDSYPSSRSPNFYSSTSHSSPSHKKEASDRIKLISPLASSQESCNSSRNEYKSGSNSALSSSMTSSTTLISSMSSSMSSSSSTAPKIDPPPKFRRTSRPIERWERGSWYNGQEVSQHHQQQQQQQQPFATDSDYYSAYGASSVSSSASGAVVLRNHSRNSSNGSAAISNAGAFRYSDSSARSSFCSDNRDSISSFTTLKQRLELKINDLNTTSSSQANQPSVSHHQPPHYSQSHHYQPKPIQPGGMHQYNQLPYHNHQNHLQAYQHQIQNGKWKTRLSYTSDENSDTCSTDFTSLASSTQTSRDERADSRRN